MLRRSGLILVLSAATLAAGCGPRGAAGRMPVPRAAAADLPAGSPLRSRTLEDTDAWLRHFAMAGQLDSLVGSFEEGSPLRPADDLQRTLQLALALHQSGDYEASNAAFEAAEVESDLRYTRSVSRMGLSMLTSDRAIDFTPSRAETLMIPYYRMHNYIRLGDIDGALVEARKVSALIAGLEDSGDECAAGPFVEHLAGLVYEMGGEVADAAVALRRAERGYGRCAGTFGFVTPRSIGEDLHRVASRAGLADVAARAAEVYEIEPEMAADEASGAGEVVVLLENGFVAHRASQNIYFPIFDEDLEGVDTSDAGELLEVTALLTARIVENMIERKIWGRAFDDVPAIQLAHALGGTYVMKLAWPVYRLEASAAPGLRVTAGETTVDAAPVQDVSGAVIRDFESRRKLVIARAVARGVVKYATAQALERRAEERSALLGFITGAAMNAAGNAFERADTRSWSLLPDRISIARLRLPAGEHRLTVEVLDADGGARTVDLGSVAVRAGERVILNQRVWGAHQGDRGRLADVTRGVAYADPVEAWHAGHESAVVQPAADEPPRPLRRINP